MAGSSKRVARRAAAQDWRKRALQLRIEGYSLREVAARLKKSPSTVHEGVTQTLREIPADDVDELRAVEGARLDGLIRAHWPQRKEAESAHVIISAITKRAKLFGLDAPTKNEHTGRDGGPIAFDLSNLSDAQLEQLIAGDTSVLGGADPSGAEGASEGGEAAPGAGPGVEG